MSKIIVRCVFLVVFLFSGAVYAVDYGDLITVKKIKINVKGEEKEDLESFYSQYVGQTISPKDLGNKIYKYFTDRDYLYPQITIFTEGLNEGFVSVYVKFTHIANVTIEKGEKDNALINEYINKILDEKESKISTFEKYIALINRIPGYYVQYKFVNSKEEDAIDALLYINKTKALIYASSDSYGDNDYGEMQNVVSGQTFSPFGSGNDSWSAYGVTTNHPDRLYVVGTSYNRVINSYGTSFEMNGSYSRDNSTYNNIISTKDGVSQSYGISSTHPLYLSANHTLEGVIGTTYNYSKDYTADVNISSRTTRGIRSRSRENFFGRINVFSRKDTIDEYWFSEAGLNYRGSDKGGGYNTIGFQFAKGMGGKFQNYTNPQDVPDGHYSIMSLNVSREQILPNNFSVMFNSMAGRSDDDLPDAEVFSLGGRQYGRGYESGTLIGNKIIAASFEVRYNKEISEDPLFRLIQPYVFRDMGYVGKQASNTNISHLSSYGGGVRFFLTHGAQINVEIAQPLQNFYTIDGIDYEPKAILGIMGSKTFRF
ncbi:MAG: hypothetical protein N4A31_07455 [Rickettsiales bacterium]|nr:hypothetical protein [Rickettsiales bacterium]